MIGVPLMARLKAFKSFHKSSSFDKMKYAIIADIHSNLEALQTVLKDSEEQGCTHYACLGDVVGYGADPKICLDMIREMDIPVVKGNHDEYIGSEMELDGFNAHAAQAVIWTREQLTEDDRKWLNGLKYLRMVQNFTIVHATLDVPRKWGYVFDKLAAAASFTYQNTSVCFFGHTHVPTAFVRDESVRGGSYSKFHVEPGKKYFVNVGSVGQSRDGVAKATYAIYDMEEHTIELRRLDYDMETTKQKILDAGLPSRLAERLDVGR